MVRTPSTSFISGTGLKKCRPTKRSARLVAAATSVSEMEEVLLAKMASFFTIASSAENIFFFRSEEVQADKAVGALGGCRNFGDRDGRGVAGEDGVFLYDRIKRREHLLLLIHVLDNGFNNDVAIGQILLAGDALQPGARPLGLFRRNAA